MEIIEYSEIPMGTRFVKTYHDKSGFTKTELKKRFGKFILSRVQNDTGEILVLKKIYQNRKDTHGKFVVNCYDIVDRIFEK
jgi:hypothetical protein